MTPTRWRWKLSLKSLIRVNQTTGLHTAKDHTVHNQRSHNFNCSVYLVGTDLQGSAAYITCWVWWYHCRDHHGSIRKKYVQKERKRMKYGGRRRSTTLQVCPSQQVFKWKLRRHCAWWGGYSMVNSSKSYKKTVHFWERRKHGRIHHTKPLSPEHTVLLIGTLKGTEQRGEKKEQKEEVREKDEKEKKENEKKTWRTTRIRRQESTAK